MTDRWKAWRSRIALAMSLGAVGACDSSPRPTVEPPATASATSAARLVEITAGPTGFSPASVSAQPGEPLTLRFTRTTTSGCLSTIALPALKVERELPLGQPVDVAVAAPMQGALAFECGMGMVRGEVSVGPAAAAPTATAAGSARAHADHDARHGGVLTMEGDYHVEIVVAPDGRVDLYVSDAVRAPVPLGEVSGSIGLRPAGAKVDTQQLPLSGDAAKGALSAEGPTPAEPREYTWELTVRGQKLRMTLAVPPGGTAKLGGPATAPSGSSRPRAKDGHDHQH
jgi:hypothetical protein